MANVKLQDDLRTFRSQHFGHPESPALRIAGSNAQVSSHHNAQSLQDDDDGLGYYPDGVKRTLTDEQIAMFRHSEIYSLLREKRLQTERDGHSEEHQDVHVLEVSEPSTSGQDESVNCQVEAPQERPPSRQDREPFEHERMDEEADIEGDDEEYIRFLVDERKQQISDAGRKKRKRHEDHQGRAKGQDWTHRRATRELDILKADETLLTYDDEPIEKATETRPAHGPERESPSQNKQQPFASVGRKIWWPSIGAG